MRWARISFLLTLGLGVGAFAHYTLPQTEIVRITGTEVIRTDLSGLNRWFYAQGDTGGTTSDSRDLRFINTARPASEGEAQALGRSLVFRNEDTGFGWPPYFKLDSADVHAEATNLTSTAANPVWVAITHYGWRNNLLSSYPNALSIRPVDGPDVRVIPWLSIAILLVLAVLGFMAWRIWERFEDRVIAPFADGAAVRWSKLKDRLGGR